jgi:membrane protease YdiL (CAAX protease family)
MAIKIVIVTFFCTWLIWGCIIAANQFGYLYDGTPLNMVFFILGALSPAIVSVTFILKNKIMPAKQLFRTIFEIKQPITSYLLVAVFFVLYIVAGVLSGTFILFTPAVLLMFPVMVIVGGLEEVCWRFVLQPPLEKKHPFVVVALIIAGIWAIWHLPLFFIAGRLQYNWNFGLYAILILGLAFLLAAIYRITKSVWLCVLFHALVNTMFEDTSFIIGLGDFNDDFVPLTITSSILIIVSCLTVKFAKNIQKRRSE